MFFKYIIAFFSGITFFEIVKLVYPDIKVYFSNKIKSKRLFHENIDSLLKSANELFGKLQSISNEDFATFYNSQNSNNVKNELNKMYIFYLFSQFWSQIEKIRIINQNQNFSAFSKGRQLIRFIETFESRKTRILDRPSQRMLGEYLLKMKSANFFIMSLDEFDLEYSIENSLLNKRIFPLKELFQQSSQLEVKQFILVYGIIIVAFLDHFDPNYKIIRKRNVYVNKLNQKSKRKLRNIVFNSYLPFISKPERYFE